MQLLVFKEQVLKQGSLKQVLPIGVYDRVTLEVVGLIVEAVQRPPPESEDDAVVQPLQRVTDSCGAEGHSPAPASAQ